MRNPTPPALIGGPYRPPSRRDHRIGAVVGDIIAGERTITGISDAPTPWPIGMAAPHGRPSPLVTAELARAVATESVEAVAYWWGVSRWTVRRWRHALGVTRFNPGTIELWRSAAAKLHTAQARRRQREAMRAWAASRAT